MNNLVTFNNSQFNLVEYNGELWMTCPQIVDALGMADRRGVSNIYQRHKIEFDDTMTCLPKMGKQRIFNREGAWLIGMFARTPKAAEFRKWVLKVLGTVVDNLTPTDKPVLVAEHTRALPSPKKEIVLSEKAKQEIGGIIKAVLQAELTKRETMKDVMREVIREEVAPFLLRDGVKRTDPHNGYVTADGLTVVNWIVGIMHGATALQSCIEQLQKRQSNAVKLLTLSAKEN